jgi:hypothetical protein
MALGVLTGTGSINSLFVLKSGSPILTQHHGDLLSEHGSFTQLTYIKARRMLEGETDGGVGWENDSVSRRFVFTLQPWAASNWFDYHLAFSDCRLAVSNPDFGGPRGSASAFESTTRGSVGINDVKITSDDNTQSDTIGWDNLELEDRWIVQAFTFDYQSKTFWNYIIDPSDGTVLQKRTVITPNDYSGAAHSTLPVPSDPDCKLSFSTVYSNNNNGGSQAYTDYDILLGEIDYWGRALSEAELVAFSQVGFAEVNSPTDLIFSANFMRNWSATSGTKQEVISSGGSPSNVWVSSRDVNSLYYVLDNPVPVYLLREINSEHDFIELGLFSATAGTARVSAYPAGTPTPSESDIFNGVGAASQLTLQPDGLAEVTGSMTGLDTGTEYVLYSVQDELDGGSFSTIAEVTINTPTKYSEIITDVTGAEVTNQTGIQWAWFDEENPSTLSSPSTQGVAELTDATGLLEITLPTSISTPKGSKGTMVLRADWGGSVQTASHVAEVK